jgi:AcrR family transcriptional regulator
LAGFLPVLLLPTTTGGLNGKYIILIKLTSILIDRLRPVYMRTAREEPFQTMPPKTARSARAAAEVGGSSRERILAQAERVFGARGFDGASMRQLANAANVPAALVSYHFGSKEGLYRAVFERRVPTVVEQRLAGLAIAMSEQDLDRRLELVVKALVFPMLHLRAHDRDPSFGRLLAHETMDPNSEQRGFIRDMFDPVARAVVEALRSALPTRTEAQLWWAYEFMLGAMVYVMGDAGRLKRLTGGLCQPDDEAASVPHMVAFLTAGVRYGMPPQLNEGNRPTKPTNVTGGKTDATRDVPKRERTAARRRPR